MGLRFLFAIALIVFFLRENPPAIRMTAAVPESTADTIEKSSVAVIESTTTVIESSSEKTIAATEDADEMQRIPKRKVALLMSYCGTGYHGMQIQ